MLLSNLLCLSIPYSLIDTHAHAVYLRTLAYVKQSVFLIPCEPSWEPIVRKQYNTCQKHYRPKDVKRKLRVKYKSVRMEVCPQTQTLDEIFCTS